MIRLVVLGISGSIGKQTLSLIEENSDLFELVGCSVYKEVDFLNEVIKKHTTIEKVCIGTMEDVLNVNFDDVLVGESGLKELVSMDCDLVVNAISGIAGLYPTIEAIRNDKDIALANKEGIVCAGDLIAEELKLHPSVNIYPIDSEHSALLQCLNGESIDDVSKLLITCSGGAFRGYTLEQLKNVASKDALKHPTWNMGAKITVDCATLFNKGFEIIEAHYLFGIDYENIEAVMHKESIVHSLVEFKDGTIKAILGSHDMRLNILYAISRLNRFPNSVQKLSLTDVKNLTFEPINKEVFKGIDIALEAAKIGESLPTVMNVANEVAVSYFLEDKISFLDIYDIVETCMHDHTVRHIHTVEDVKEVEALTKDYAKELIERRFVK